jgi:hypothetical protein
LHRLVSPFCNITTLERKTIMRVLFAFTLVLCLNAAGLAEPLFRQHVLAGNILRQPTIQAAQTELLESATYIDSVVVVMGIAIPTYKTWVNANNLYGPTTAGQESYLATARTVDTFSNATLSGTLNANPGAVVFGLAPAASPPDTTSTSYLLSVTVVNNAGIQAIYLQEQGSLRQVVTSGITSPMTISVVVQNGAVQVLAGSTSIYTTTIPPQTLRGFFQATFGASITGVMLQ